MSTSCGLDMLDGNKPNLNSLRGFRQECVKNVSARGSCFGSLRYERVNYTRLGGRYDVAHIPHCILEVIHLQSTLLDGAYLVYIAIRWIFPQSPPKKKTGRW